MPGGEPGSMTGGVKALFNIRRSINVRE